MDIELHCTESGSGFPLVLLHGNGESSECFKNQIGFFSKEYRVAAVDTRGHGASPRGTAPFTLAQFAEDLKCFLDGRGLKRIHLLGFSDGANVALLFALKYPRYIEKLVLNGANLSAKGVKPSTQIPICIGYAAASALAPFNKKAMRKKELLGLMIGQPNIGAEELGSLRIPTLVIAGTKDMIKSAHTRLIAKSIPNAALSIVPGSHFIAAENSEAFNREVYGFLKEELV